MMDKIAMYKEQIEKKAMALRNPEWMEARMLYRDMSSNPTVKNTFKQFSSTSNKHIGTGDYLRNVKNIVKGKPSGTKVNFIKRPRTEGEYLNRQIKSKNILDNADVKATSLLHMSGDDIKNTYGSLGKGGAMQKYKQDKGKLFSEGNKASKMSASPYADTFFNIASVPKSDIATGYHELAHIGQENGATYTDRYRAALMGEKVKNKDFSRRKDKEITHFIQDAFHRNSPNQNSRKVGKMVSNMRRDALNSSDDMLLNELHANARSYNTIKKQYGHDMADKHLGGIMKSVTSYAKGTEKSNMGSRDLIDHVKNSRIKTKPAIINESKYQRKMKDNVEESRKAYKDYLDDSSFALMLKEKQKVSNKTSRRYFKTSRKVYEARNNAIDNKAKDIIRRRSSAEMNIEHPGVNKVFGD